MTDENKKHQIIVHEMEKKIGFLEKRARRFRRLAEIALSLLCAFFLIASGNASLGKRGEDKPERTPIVFQLGTDGVSPALTFETACEKDVDLIIGEGVSIKDVIRYEDFLLTTCRVKSLRKIVVPHSTLKHQKPSKTRRVP